MLKVYNIYPRNYSNINAMKDRVKEIKSLGFDVIWINPIQKTGEEAIKQKVNLLTGEIVVEPKGSLYSMASTNDFIDGFNEDELKIFSKECKKYNIILMFDLVLGHVAPNSECEFDILKIFLTEIDDKEIQKILSNTNIKLYKDFLIEIKKQKEFKGLIKIINNKLLESGIFKFEEVEGVLKIGRSTHFKDTTRIVYIDKNTGEINKNACKILEQFWKPFIKNYLDYGFSGIRVDSAMRVPAYFRAELYEYAKKECQNIIIFEENLFKEDFDETMLKIGNTGADYMTNDLYYATPNDVSGFPKKANDTLIRRNELVKHGCINFTGNHDEAPLALTVIRELAFEKAHRADESFLRPTSDVAFNHLALQSYYQELYRYIPKVVEEINIDENYRDEFLKEINKRLSYLIFGSNGGYYMLDGDEDLNILVPTVFDYENSTDLKIDCNIREKITEMNRIFNLLPQSKNMWFEYFKVNDNISALIRKEEAGFDVPTNIIIFNHSEENQEFGKDDLHKLACDFQARTKPDGRDRDIAYWIITEENDYGNKVNIYGCGNVDLKLC